MTKINNDSLTHLTPICHNGDIPEEYEQDFKDVKLSLSVDGRSTQYLFGGFRYPMDNKAMVLENPLDYFAPGYKGCSANCRFGCENVFKRLIRNANDNTLKWSGRDTFSAPLWKPEYKQFCINVGSDFHPKTCYCQRCWAIRRLSRDFRFICPCYHSSFDAKYDEARKNVGAAIQSGLGLDYVTNPIFPFLSHRMLQQLATKEGLTAAGTSADLMSSLSRHRKKYDVDEIMLVFDQKSLKAFCKRYLKNVKLNKGKKHMIRYICNFLEQAQDKAGRKICSDSWVNVLDFLGKSWIELY